MNASVHPIAFDRPHRIAALPFGIDPAEASVSLSEDRLVASYGRWRVETDVDNVESISITGPYSFAKTAGPPHLSFRDRGLTFAGNSHRGVCFAFREPVRGIEPLGLVRHRGLTVTVEDPEALAAELERRGIARADVLDDYEEQVAEDALHTAPTSTLRRLASERGIAGASSLSHEDLVAALEPQLDPELADRLEGEDRPSGR